MLKKSRIYFSAVLSALVLASLLMTSSVKACEEAPQSLLSLYMNSDLVVIAKYDSESEAKKANEDEYGYTLETDRKLVISKIFKGQRELRTVSFAYSQYVSKPSQETTETEETPTETEEYFELSKIKIGGEYLFFLTKNKETGAYSVSDYVSGVKELDKNRSLYEKNLSELERIVAAKENQYELLTEWIVRSIENKETREDGIQDLSESFYGLTWQEEDERYKGKGPFVVGEEGYGTYTVGVAKHLTQAQKDRVSAVLYPVLQDAWFGEKTEYVHHGISAILGGINRSRLALYTYNAMQSADKNDFEKRRLIGEFLSDFLGDETFSTLHYGVLEIEGKLEEAKENNDATPQGKKQLKDLNLARDAKLKELDKRFKFLLGRNFVPENKTV